MAKRAEPLATYPAMPTDAWRDRDVFERWKADERDFWRQTYETQAKLGADDVVGVIVAFREGDGMSEYIVTRARPLTLSWIPTPGSREVPEQTIARVVRADVAQAKARNAMMPFPARRQPLIALRPVPRPQS